MSDLVRHLRIFLSSPSDVPEERQIAREVIKQLQYEPQFKDRLYLEPVAWDEPGAGTPMLATKIPQAAIDAGLPTPAKCDIVVVIFWARMGTPLPYPEYKKENNEPYYSGAEWEFENAINANRLNPCGRPEVVLYRRTEKVLLDDEAPDYERKLAQKRMVRKFFDQCADSKTGAILRGVNHYEKPEDFRRDVANHLRKLIGKLMAEPTPTPASGSTAVMPPQKLLSWSGSPFPGLRPFTDKDAPIFFGRGRETDDLVDGINRNRFVTVVGASGSGKSSLVWAGVIPRLEANAISNERTGSKDWLWLRMTPGGVGDNPFMALAAKLELYLPGSEAREIAAKLAAEPKALGQLIPRILAGRPEWAELLLFIDQLEELVTVATQTCRAPFAEMLCLAVEAGQFRAVATLRADFYHQLIPISPALVELLQKGSYPLGAPDQVSLYDMIVRPAEQAGLQFEGDLARRIVNDTGDEPGALALTAYLLDELYQRRTDGRLTLKAYTDLGGVARAIGERAEQAFRALSPDAQAALPHVFLRLVAVDERGTATRRRALLEEIERSAPAAATELLGEFTKARLLVTAEQGDKPTVEVAHEALLREWERLANWITRTQDDQRLLEQVKLAAEEWNQQSREETYRWPHERLVLVYEMIERLELDEARHLSEVQREFVRREADRLLEEIQKPETSHDRRRSIGERLAVIGDPRSGVGFRPDGLPDIDWCSVEAAGRSSVEVEIEKIVKIKVSLPFRIARYQITHRQFQSFIDAPDGYHNRERDWFAGLAADEGEKQPGEQRFKFDNHPRETVNWYEAMAFCRWLSWRLEALKDSPSDSEMTARNILNPLTPLSPFRGAKRPGFDLLNPFTWLVRLPTEAEWQLATAGPSARAYPWGDDWDGRRANTWESGLSHTTAVGMYPAGGAACGALDMSGNVSEWTLTGSRSGTSDDITHRGPRVVRGGSWYDDQHCARAAFRSHLQPVFRDHRFGFRVVGLFPSF